ncbi:MAG: ankyrin repeat domain-containing protein [Puniceicoccales bacterium]|jgi:ankyrin repeat protein|nr:ankyrin repeat domain-containing protein [Puniceicoccales bacterium]
MSPNLIKKSYEKNNKMIKNILGKSFLLGGFLAMTLQMQGSLPSSGQAAAIQREVESSLFLETNTDFTEFLVGLHFLLEKYGMKMEDIKNNPGELLKKIESALKLGLFSANSQFPPQHLERLYALKKKDIDKNTFNILHKLLQFSYLFPKGECESNELNFVLANKEDFEKTCDLLETGREEYEMLERVFQDARETEIETSTSEENEEEFLEYFWNLRKGVEAERDFLETLTARIEKNGIANTKLKEMNDDNRKIVISSLVSPIGQFPSLQLAIQKSWLMKDVFDDQVIHRLLGWSSSRDWTLVEFLIQNKPEVWERLRNDSSGKGLLFLLHRAVEKNNFDITELLLKNGANASSVYNKKTSLHLAVEKKHLEIVQLLLAHKANVNTANSSGQTPLYLAVEQKDLGIVQLLFDHGADEYINQKDCWGQTPLHLAVEQKHLGIVQLLLAHGADAKEIINQRSTLLHLAVEKNHLGIVKLLLAHGANVYINKKGHWDRTPLHLACTKMIRRKLKEYGATFEGE